MGQAFQLLPSWAEIVHEGPWGDPEATLQFDTKPRKSTKSHYFKNKIRKDPPLASINISSVQIISHSSHQFQMFFLEYRVMFPGADPLCARLSTPETLG